MQRPWMALTAIIFLEILSIKQAQIFHKLPIILIMASTEDIILIFRKSRKKFPNYKVQWIISNFSNQSAK